MRYIIFVLLALNLYAVDATLKIETDVEHRSRIAIEDGSPVPNIQFFKILLSDLKITGHFLVDTTAYKGDTDAKMIAPNLRSQEYILRYIFTQNSGTKLIIRLLKAGDGTEIFKKSYAIPSTKKSSFLAHKAITDINKILKYPDVSWLNRYVVFARYTTPKHSEIILADYTFNYKKVIIRGGLNLFPKWADANQRSFYYTSYAGTIPTLYRLNIYSGSKQKIVSSEGMLVCSDVSKNGSKILLTMAPEGQADIYEVTVSSRAKQKITSFKGIDVNGKIC